ncbi:hypothetical protein [Gillisia sp. CAL575]|uniref:hypothetical protein n=1 Tax=Gillisia sp. CAL575 TaxID=985255 RepID=UPI0003AA4160|nr:hypothetical protein [Gillisia sp. CAL575]
MNNLNLFQKYGILGLTFMMLLPSILSFNHVFAHDFNFACDDHSTTHLHQSSLDCELCDFHPRPIIVYQFLNFNLDEVLLPNKKFFNSYEFLSDFQKLSFSLRGPPALYQNA